MKRSVVVWGAIALICSLTFVSAGTAASVCKAKGRAMGFTTEKSLLEFVAKAKSDPGGLSKFLEGLTAAKQAFVLKAGEALQVVERKAEGDPMMGRVKVQSSQAAGPIWVPAAALSCN